MTTIKNDYMAHSRDYLVYDRQDFQSKKTYYVCRQVQRSGPAFCLLTCQDATSLCPFPEPLKERIKALAQAAFLKIEFNPEDKIRHIYKQSYERPWSFEIDVPSAES